MMLPANGVRVYLALGATDMRKAIDGLPILVSQQLRLDPFIGHLFGFCNRSRTISSCSTGIATGFVCGKSAWNAIFSAGRLPRPKSWPSIPGNCPGCSTVSIPWP